jgi:hypothetical protein
MKQCGCGATYSAEAWLGLPLVGFMGEGDGPWRVELRNCACGTTLAVTVPNGLDASTCGMCGDDVAEGETFCGEACARDYRAEARAERWADEARDEGGR